MLLDYIIISLYLIIIVYIGIHSSSKLTSLKDFSTSNKKYGSFCLVATLSSSFIGGGFSTGNATNVMESGISSMVALMGFSIAMIILGKFVVPRIHHTKDLSSVGEIMKSFYGEYAGIFTGFFGMMICAGILAAQISAIGYLFNVFLGINSVVGIIIGCGVVVIYSTLGGMRSVVTIDTIQFVVMSIGIVILVALSIKSVGGLSPLIANTPSTHFNIFSNRSVISFISLALSLALGEILAPPYVQRLLIGKNLKTTSKATIISGFLSIIFFICTGCIGLAGRLFFADTYINSNLVMQMMIKQIVPIGVRGIIIAGTISIVMSSADSFLNSSSVCLLNDVILEVSNKKHTERQKLKMIRLVNLITGSIAIIIAIAIPNILDVLSFSYSFWSPFVFAPLLYALLGIKSKPRAFYVSMVCGGIGLFTWEWFLQSPFDINSTVVGVLANVISFLIIRR